MKLNFKSSIRGNFEKVVKKHMIDSNISTYLELADITGLGYQTMRSHIRKPEQLRLFEFRALDEVLKFEDSEKLALFERG